MNIIKHYKIEETEQGINLIVYIEPYFVEFASEDGDVKENYSLKEELSRLIKTKLKETKVNLCKVMVGTTLLLAIPAAALPVYASETVSYQVQKGDTLWKIAGRFDIPISDIKSANNLQTDTIYINQKLTLPTDSFIQHQVAAGDTLYKIALKYNQSIDSIKQINNLTSDMIYTGDYLYIIRSISNTVPETYKVVSGDTLWKISSKFNISITKLKSINNLTSDVIYPGQLLSLKAQVSESTEPYVIYESYKVAAGDNLWSIAVKQGIPYTELMQVNGFSKSTTLNIGQIIKVPVHVVPVTQTQGEQYGEYLDWWNAAQYVFPINATAKIIDVETGRSFNIKRTIGANHADCEPLTTEDSALAKEIWNGYSWSPRAVIVETSGRRIAGSMSFMPHGIEYIYNNNFDGHFDLHFKNSTRHNDGEIDSGHQEQVRIAAGII